MGFQYEIDWQHFVDEVLKIYNKYGSCDTFALSESIRNAFKCTPGGFVLSRWKKKFKFYCATETVYG